jgi:superfamily I DNA/RNA helicase
MNDIALAPTPAGLVEIHGNTYPVKDKLKALGARWNSAYRCWMIAADLAEKAAEIVGGTALVGKAGPTYAGQVTSPEPERVWSDEQKAIFAWFATGTGNLVVQARAGTGKTTTIKQAFSCAPEAKILYAVFNKKNQKEALEKIVDSRVEVKTLHSLGFAYIKNMWRDARPDDGVEYDRVDQVVPRIDDDTRNVIVKLVGFCKNLTVGIPSLNEVLDIIDARDIYAADATQFSSATLAKIAIDVLHASLIRDDRGRISFNDMVWLPVAADWVRPWFDLVTVDEAQDMNMPQLLMAERACKSNGRICVVGDDRQAIYGFRGAASDGMHMMRQRLNATQLGLTTTYRCPRLVVEIAQTIVSDYTAAPSAPEGEVIYTTVEKIIESLQVGDAVVSRLNAPLMGIALKLLRNNIPARIEGRDIGKQIIAQVRKFKAKSVPDFLKKVSAWAEKQTKRIESSGGRHVQSKVELVMDQALTLTTVAQDCTSVENIEQRITNLFEDSDNCRREAVVCSSVHKAKGLEWNRVCIIEDTFKNKDKSNEEANIFYVAVTRAKKVLVRAAQPKE